ncbi:MULTISPECIES: collagen-like protein [Chryseobacterium]|uniref:Collagen-like protein n=1 Tax=Chryseobacterium endophyticum TaxID=1854762 RepID=A0AAU6WPV3_9FLAO|nr:collagen-like protein [uncultured Chryseobacterium sp.]
MKKIVLAAGLLLSAQLAFAQAPEKMSYQAIIRNAGGQVLANQNVGVRVSVLQGSPSGTAVYSERLTGNTNANGLLTMELGTGTVLSGTFNTINWPSGSYYLKTETDPTGGTAYTITGTSQLLSVPYAMFAKSAGGVSGGTSLAIPYANTFTNAGNLFSLTNNGDGASLEGINTTTTSNIAAVRGMVTNTSPGGFSAAVRGNNSGTGGLGIGVYGSQDGSGWGVYGTNPAGIGVYGNGTAAGYGVYANSNTGTGLNAVSTNGIAASMSIFNTTNNNNVLNANTVGNGTVMNVSTTGTGKGVSSTSGTGYAIHGTTSSQISAGIVGDNSGAGEAIVGRNTSDIAGAVVGRNDGGGYGVRGFISTNTSGNGIGVYGQVGVNSSTGKAGKFENVNSSNTVTTLEVSTVGNGNASDFTVNNTNGTSAALHGKVNSMFANFGTAGVYGESIGTGGYAGLFYQRNTSGTGPAVLALADGSGNGVTANAGGSGDGVEATVDGSGNAIYGWTPNFSAGRAGYFRNFNTANSQATLTVANAGTGSALLVNHTGSSGNLAVFQNGNANVARINKSGTAFFNGGTQNSGADVAEAFDVEGNVSAYEPGDILIISTDADRTVEKSSKPYSNLVAGVYATKPGVLLTEENIDSELLGKVPMGVIGVIPTKVCLEGGKIKRGDLLVTSSQPGVAMKANPKKVKIGQVIGKALQDYDQPETGKIRVLVSIK